MCLNPRLLPNGQLVACRVCWQCLKAKIDDWSGRCIAETKTSVAAHSVTLTYGRDGEAKDGTVKPFLAGSPDHVRAAMLGYADVSLYLKRLRSKLPDVVEGHPVGGFPVRFFVVGEYGSLKGRSHWHIILFWQKRVPQHVLGKRFFEPHWPHGWSQWKPATFESVRYACKYITKGVGDDHELQVHQGMSRYPPLGDEYFRRLAENYAKQGLAPQSLEYTFDECRRKSGEIVRFRMRGRTAQNFIGHFERAWRLYQGAAHMPNSVLVEETLDRMLPVDPERAKRDLDEFGVLDRYVGMIEKPRPTYETNGQDGIRDWMDPDRVRWSEKLKVWCYCHESSSGGGYWYWCRDSEGVWGWHEKIGAKGVATVRPSAPTQRSYGVESGRNG